MEEKSYRVPAGKVKCSNKIRLISYGGTDKESEESSSTSTDDAFEIKTARLEALAGTIVMRLLLLPGRLLACTKSNNEKFKY